VLRTTMPADAERHLLAAFTETAPQAVFTVTLGACPRR
jgi:hypothetical protein